MVRAHSLSLVLIVCLSGCVTKELYRDQDKLRHVVIDLYQNQVLDNLIRTANAQMLVQMDYATISGQVSNKTTANFGGNQEVDVTNTSNKLTAAAAGTLAVTTRLWKSFMSYGGTGEHLNQVSMVGAPVNNADDVYEAYYIYLSLPNALLITDKKPPDCEAHVAKKHCGKWYWVPMERRIDYLKLQMATTVTRGKRLIKSQEAYEVKLKVQGKPVDSTEFKGALEYTFKLDKKIPADNGYVELTFGTYKQGFNLIYDRSDPPQTDTIKFTLNPKKFEQGDFPKEIKSFAEFDKVFKAAPDGYPAKIFLARFRPQDPTLKELIDPLYQQMELLKLNQLR